MKNSILFFFVSLSCSLIGQDTYDYSNTFEVNPTGILNLSSEDAEVFITGTDRKNVYVEVFREIKTTGWTKYTDDFDMKYELDQGNLNIEELTKKGTSAKVMFGSIKSNYTIKIEMPSTMALNVTGDDDDYEISNLANGLTLEYEDGDLELENISGGKIEIFAEDGDLIFEDCKAKVIELRNEDGNIKMYDCEGRFELKTSDGDVHVKRSSFPELLVRGDDGDFVFTLDGPTDADIRISDGDLSLTCNGTAATPTKATLEAEDGDMDVDLGLVSSLDIDFGDGDVSTRCGFTQDAEVFVKSQDGDIVMKLDDGHGTFELMTDDGDISYPSSFDVKKDKESYKVITRGNTKATAELRTSDGNITIK